MNANPKPAERKKQREHMLKVGQGIARTKGEENRIRRLGYEVIRLNEELAASEQRAERMREALERTWISECEIIHNYMPPYPTPGTRPRVVVRHKPSRLFLRYSAGPRTGTFWDCYGDDFLDVDLAKSELWKSYPPNFESWHDSSPVAAERENAK